MPSAVLQVVGSRAAQNKNVTGFYGPVLGTVQTTETTLQVVYQTGGTMSLFTVLVGTNTVTAASSATVRQNAGNGNETVSIGSSATGAFQDTTHTDTVASGDKMAVQVITGATGTSMFVNFSAQFVSSTASTVCRQGQAGAVTYPSNVSRFTVWAGNLLGGTLETATSTIVRFAATSSNLNLNVSSNTCNGSTTITSRRNTANGNMTLSVGASTTGFFADTTHSDTISSGDTTDFSVATGGSSGIFTIGTVAMDLASPSNSFLLIYARGDTISTSTNFWFPLGGITNTVTGEAAAQVSVVFAIVCQSFQAGVQTNTITATSTMTVRKNGANAKGTLSIGASTTGSFEDTTDVDVFAAGDKAAYQIATGSTGTSVVVDTVAFGKASVGVYGWGIVR